MERGRDNIDPRLLKRIDEQKGREAVVLADLSVGAVITVHTQNSVYVLRKAVDGYFLQGGSRWPTPTIVAIPGCTFGGSTIMVGSLSVSMHMEIVERYPTKIITTSAIKAIEVN